MGEQYGVRLVHIHVCMPVYLPTHTTHILTLHPYACTAHIYPHLLIMYMYLETLGYTAEEYIGHHIMEFCMDPEIALTRVFTDLGKHTYIHSYTYTVLVHTRKHMLCIPYITYLYNTYTYLVTYNTIHILIHIHILIP